jgi:CubicO group peptidase (beta-lactamase class C family)
MIDKVSAFSERASKTCDKVAAELPKAGVAPNVAAGFVVDGAIHVGGETKALFDLASVTKSVFAVSVARGALRRWTPLGSLLDVARGTPAEDASLELLLAHRAGFPAHLPLFAPLVEGGRVDVRQALESACMSRAPSPDRGASPPLYSDVGYLLAGFAVGAEPLMNAQVIEPLGLGKTLGSAHALEAHGIDVIARAAPTETVGWRGGEVRGRVHDENAWALARDGTCGHAGLFGTIGAVLRFGAFVLDHIGELDWLVREREGGTLRAGFDGKSTTGSSAGSVLGPRSFGHLGFTGTSMWIDPDARIVVALLSNRVCPTRDNTRIRDARPGAHDALARAALAMREQPERG